MAHVRPPTWLQPRQVAGVKRPRSQDVGMTDHGPTRTSQSLSDGSGVVGEADEGTRCPERR
jgi:hypothetical protein